MDDEKTGTLRGVIMIVVCCILILLLCWPKHKTPDTAAPATPTHLQGKDYAIGLVMEYHETVNTDGLIGSFPIRGHFTVVVGDVEYKADETPMAAPVRINPGYYQVYAGTLDNGTIAVIVGINKPWVFGYITESRFVGSKK
jgi:hypothetical protein